MEKKLKKVPEELYNWLFHNDHYSGTVSAFHKDDYNAFWNGEHAVHKVYTSFNKTMNQISKEIIKDLKSNGKN